jgi:hypothetical protein
MPRPQHDLKIQGNFLLPKNWDKNKWLTNARLFILLRTKQFCNTCLYISLKDSWQAVRDIPRIRYSSHSPKVPANPLMLCRSDFNIFLFQLDRFVGNLIRRDSLQFCMYKTFFIINNDLFFLHT